MGNAIKNRRRQAQIREYAEPRGLYDTCAWDRRWIRKEILSGKLAPCFPGEEGSANRDIGMNEAGGGGRSSIIKEKDKLGVGFGDLEECPICLLFYPGGLNRMTCCKQSMCTECYLQVKEPPTHFTTPRSRCPFCKSDKFDHVYTGPLSMEQKKAQEIEQQKVLELQIKMQSEERKKDQERQLQRTKVTEGPDDTKASIDEKKPQHLRSTSFSLSSATPESEPTETEPDNQTTNVTEGTGGGLVVGIGGGGGDYEMNEIEQAMLEEALRRSLVDSKAFSSAENQINDGEISGGSGGSVSNVASAQAESLDIKSHAPSINDLNVAPLLDEEEDGPEDGDDLNQAILLSLELHSSASSSSSSSSISSSLS